MTTFICSNCGEEWDEKTAFIVNGNKVCIDCYDSINDPVSQD